MTENYYALSIRQPWANLIVSGKKSIEVRKWENPYRGKLFIHAGKQIDKRAASHFVNISITPVFSIIGSVILADIIVLDSNNWEQLKPFHRNWWDYQGEALYGWVFKNPTQLAKPNRWAGKLGLFEIPFNPEKV